MKLDARKPYVEVREGKVVAYFPNAIDAAFLTADEAREWGEALVSAGQAARVMMLPTDRPRENG